MQADRSDLWFVFLEQVVFETIDKLLVSTVFGDGVVFCAICAFRPLCAVEASKIKAST